jgi:hypothetical protein
VVAAITTARRRCTRPALRSAASRRILRHALRACVLISVMRLKTVLSVTADHSLLSHGKARGFNGQGSGKCDGAALTNFQGMYPVQANYLLMAGQKTAHRLIGQLGTSSFARRGYSPAHGPTAVGPICQQFRRRVSKEQRAGYQEEQKPERRKEREGAVGMPLVVRPCMHKSTQPRRRSVRWSSLTSRGAEFRDLTARYTARPKGRGELQPALLKGKNAHLIFFCDSCPAQPAAHVRLRFYLWPLIWMPRPRFGKRRRATRAAREAQA